MHKATSTPLPAVAAPPLAGPMLVIAAFVLGCSLYANLSWLVTSSNGYRFFPPFERGVNHNENAHLGAEYYNIAGALLAGRGYADPFRSPTGPTAWMPPMLSWLLAAMRWAADDDKDIVVALFVLLQDLTLIGTGWLVVALARRVIGGVWLATFLYGTALLGNFRLCFQFTHDCWIILAALDLLVAGMVWARPFTSTWRAAAAWGIFGGLCALTSPVAGFTWGMLALSAGARSGSRGRLAVAVAVAVLTITPWMVRNYLVFGRLIPVKANLAFELYQSQCRRPDGLLRGGIFAGHPYVSNNKERRRYARLGETAYLDEKMALFRESLEADPSGFLRRVGNRFLAATVLYTPFDGSEERRRPWTYRANRWTYPLAFACLVGIVLATAWQAAFSIRPEATRRRRAPSAVAIVIGVYLAYLLPYVAISFYDRYKLPLLAAEVPLIACGIDGVRRRFPWPRSGGKAAEVIVVEEVAPVLPRNAVAVSRAGPAASRSPSRARVKQQTDGVEP